MLLSALRQNFWFQCNASLRRSIFVWGSHLGTANFRQRNDLVVLAHHPTKMVEATQVTLPSLHNVSRPFTKPMNFIAMNNQRACGVLTWALQKFTSATADHPARTVEEILNNLLQPGTNQVCSVFAIAANTFLLSIYHLFFLHCPPSHRQTKNSVEKLLGRGSHPSVSIFWKPCKLFNLTSTSMWKIT